MTTTRGFVVALLVLLCPRVSTGESVTVRPRAIDDVLFNPGIGVEMWHRATWGSVPKSYPEVTLTYYRWYWGEIEPGRGDIRWDLIDAAFEDAASQGDRLGLRIMTVGGRRQGSYQGKTGSMAVPEWWAERVGGYWYDDVFWPDYNGEAFLEEAERIMKAFGERYADHPGLNHLDTSFFGCWGEQNDACIPGKVKEEHFWTPATYRKAIDIQFEAFPDVPIMQLGSADAAMYDYPMKVRKTGWRVDCFGDYRNFGPNWNHMESYYPQIIERYGDAWQHGMVSFEICGSIQTWVDLEYDFKMIMDKALEWHGSSLNLKAGKIPDEWMPILLETLKSLGYRLRIDELTHPEEIGVGDPWPLRMVWVNEGVAPPYHIYPIAVGLRGDGGCNWTHQTKEVDVRTWLPGTHVVELSVPPPDLPAGTYTLSVALPDRHPGMPAIQLANEGKGDDGFYELSTIRVVR